MASNLKDALDACPFKPDVEPPPKTLTTNLMERLDWFYDGWRNTILVVFVLSLMIVAALAASIPPLISYSSTPSTWDIDLTPDYSSTGFNYLWVEDTTPDVIVTEDLILEGDQVLEIVDTIYQVNGNVYLRNNSKLILRNSSLILFYNISPINRRNNEIVLSDSSSLILENSILNQTDRYFELISKDQSSIQFRSSFFGDCSLYLEDECTAQIANSSILRLYYSGSTHGLITESKIMHVDFDGRYQTLVKDGDLTFIDCEINYFYVELFGDAIIDDTIMNNPQVWNSYTDTSLAGTAFNLTLIDSKVLDRAYFYVINGSCNVNDCTDEIGIGCFNSTVSIRDSYLLLLSCDYTSTLSLENSAILIFHVSDDTSYDYNGALTDEESEFRGDITQCNIGQLSIDAESIIHFNQTIVHEINLSGTNITFSGDVTFAQPIDFGSPPYWLESYSQFAYRQDYRVQVQGDSHVLSNIPVVLLNDTGSVVWEGRTDSNGQAFFNITYCNYYPLYEPYHYVTNYEDTWTLRVDSDGHQKEVPISFLETNSYVTVTLPEPGVLQLINFTPVTQTGLVAILIILLGKLLKRG